MNDGIRLSVGERVLDSGLTLLAVHNPRVPTFACVMSLDIRAGAEPIAQSGLANLVGECLDEGTRRYSGLELAAAAERLGAAMEGNHRGGVVMSPAATQKEALALLREMVLEPEFPGREVRRVQAEVLTEIKAEEDDPRAVAARRFRKEVYADHPLGRPTHGSAASVAKCRPRDLRTFHSTWFRPQGGYVAVSGPEEPAKALDRLHLVEGLLVAILDIDEVIEVITRRCPPSNCCRAAAMPICRWRANRCTSTSATSASAARTRTSTCCR